MELLVKYLQGEVLKGYELLQLTPYLTWFDIPTPTNISNIIVEGEYKHYNQYKLNRSSLAQKTGIHFCQNLSIVSVFSLWRFFVNFFEYNR